MTFCVCGECANESMAAGEVNVSDMGRFWKRTVSEFFPGVPRIVLGTVGLSRIGHLPCRPLRDTIACRRWLQFVGASARPGVEGVSLSAAASDLPSGFQ